MKKLILFGFVLISHFVFSQKNDNYFPTIYNSDYIVPPPVSQTYFNDSLGNMFDNIFYEEYEVFEGGFKEKKYRLYNWELLKTLKGKTIIFNPNSLIPERIFGMYKKPEQKQEYILNSHHKKPLPSVKHNIYKVLDVGYSKTN